MNKKTREQPTYYGILPAEIRYSKLLSPMEKIMYAEISALASKTGKCWGSNGYFAELYDVQPTTVSEWINNLKRAGYVNITGADSKNRVISLINILRKKDKIPKDLTEGQPKEKAEHNNTSINTINNSVVNVEATSQTTPFNCKEYLKAVMEKNKDKNKARYFSAYYLKRKGMSFKSAEATESAMLRHLRASKQLGMFVSDMDKLQKAFADAENLVVNGQRVDWTLDTVYKLITK